MPTRTTIPRTTPHLDSSPPDQYQMVKSLIRTNIYTVGNNVLGLLHQIFSGEKLRSCIPMVQSRGVVFTNISGKGKKEWPQNMKPYSLRTVELLEPKSLRIRRPSPIWSESWSEHLCYSHHFGVLTTGISTAYRDSEWSLLVTPKWYALERQMFTEKDHCLEFHGKVWKFTP